MGTRFTIDSTELTRNPERLLRLGVEAVTAGGNTELYLSDLSRAEYPPEHPTSTLKDLGWSDLQIGAGGGDGYLSATARLNIGGHQWLSCELRIQEGGTKRKVTTHGVSLDANNIAPDVWGALRDVLTPLQGR